jgi:hypothetical protein
MRGRPYSKCLHKCSVADPDPGSGVFLPGMEKNPDPDLRSGMNIPVNFAGRLETVFRVKILKFFDEDPDPGSGIFFTLDPGWKISDPGSGINIPEQ